MYNIQNLFIEFHFKTISFYHNVVGFIFIGILNEQNEEKSQITKIKSDNINCKLDSPVIVQLEKSVRESEFKLNLYIASGCENIIKLSTKVINGKNLSFPFSDFIYFYNERDSVIAECSLLISIKNQMTLDVIQLKSECPKYDWNKIKTNPEIDQHQFSSYLNSIRGNDDYIQDIKDYVLFVGEGEIMSYYYEDNIVQNKQIKENMRQLSYQAISALPNRCVFISGGVDLVNGIIYSDCILYNPQIDKAYNLSPLQKKRFYHSQIFFDKQIFVFGGRYYGDDENSVLSSCEAFNFNTKKWISIPNMIESRYAHTAVHLNNKIYVFGGNNGKEDLSSIEVYDETCQDWKLLSFKNNNLKLRDLYVQPISDKEIIIIFGKNDNDDRYLDSNNTQQLNLIEEKQYVWELNIENLNIDPIIELKLKYEKVIAFRNRKGHSIWITNSLQGNNFIEHVNVITKQSVIQQLNIFSSEQKLSRYASCQISIFNQMNKKCNMQNQNISQEIQSSYNGQNEEYFLEINYKLVSVFTIQPKDDQFQLIKQFKCDQLEQNPIHVIELTNGYIFIAFKNSFPERKSYLIDILNETLYQTNQMKYFYPIYSLHYCKTTGLLYFFSEKYCQYYLQFQNKWKSFPNFFKSNQNLNQMQEIKNNISQIVTCNSIEIDTIIYILTDLSYIYVFDAIQGVIINIISLIEIFSSYEQNPQPELQKISQDDKSTLNIYFKNGKQIQILIQNNIALLSYEKLDLIYNKFEIKKDKYLISNSFLDNLNITPNEKFIFFSNKQNEEFYYIFTIDQQRQYFILKYSLTSGCFSYSQLQNTQNDDLNETNINKNLQQIKNQRPYYRLCSCIDIGNQSIILTGGLEELVTSGNAIKKSRIYQASIEQFQEIQDMIEPRINHQLCIFEKYILAIGGRNNYHKNQAISSVEKYDLLKNEWSNLPSLNYSRFDFSACSTNKKTFVCGGRDNEELFDSFEVFDGIKWEIISINLPQKLYGQRMIVQSLNDIIILGGMKYRKSKSVLKLNISNYTLKDSNTTMEKGISHFHVFNHVDKILVLGGKGNMDFDLVEIKGCECKFY